MVWLAFYTCAQFGVEAQAETWAIEPLDAGKSQSRTGGPSISLGNRLASALWMATWLLLARWTPPPLHGWRTLLLPLLGA